MVKGSSSKAWKSVDDYSEIVAQVKALEAKELQAIRLRVEQWEKSRLQNEDLEPPSKRRKRAENGHSESIVPATNRDESREGKQVEEASKSPAKKTKTSRKDEKDKSKNTQVTTEDLKDDLPTSQSKSPDTIQKPILKDEKSRKWAGVATALDGGSARKSKFMRLLGAGAGAIQESQTRDDKEAKEEIRKRERELEKQFDAGLKMKNEAGGRRKGLGA